MNKVLNVCVTLHKQLVAHLGLHSEKTGLCKKRECMYIYIYKPTYDDTIKLIISQTHEQFAYLCRHLCLISMYPPPLSKFPPLRFVLPPRLFVQLPLPPLDLVLPS